MRSTSSRASATATILLALTVLALPAGAEPVATITASVDDTGHHYSWTVANDHSSPLTRIEIPHYEGDLFSAPNGWSTKLETPADTGESLGRCTAEAKDTLSGIVRAGSAVFKLRVGPKGAQRGRGEVRCVFADGSEVLITTDIPVREPASDRNVPLIGLGGIFVLLLIVRARRRRRVAPQSPQQDT